MSTSAQIDNAFDYIQNKPSYAALSALKRDVLNYAVHREPTFIGYDDREVNTEAFMILKAILVLGRSLPSDVIKSLKDKTGYDLTKQSDVKAWYTKNAPSTDDEVSYSRNFILTTFQLCEEIDKRLISQYEGELDAAKKVSAQQSNKEREKLLPILGDIKRRIRRFARDNELESLEGELPNVEKLRKALAKFAVLQQPYEEIAREESKGDETNENKHTDYCKKLANEESSDFVKLPEEFRRYRYALLSANRLKNRLIKLHLNNSEHLDTGTDVDLQTWNKLKALWQDYLKFRGRRVVLEDINNEYNTLTATLREQPFLKLVLEQTYDHFAKIYHLDVADSVSSQNVSEQQSNGSFRKYDSYFKRLRNTSDHKENTLLFSNLSEQEVNPEWGSRRYAWIPQADLVLEENTQRRKKKKLLDKISFNFTKAIAIGEGVVAGFFAYAALIAFGVAGGWAYFFAILIGASGSTCNFFLFRSDSFKCFKNLFFLKQRFFVDKNGNEVHWFTKILMGFFTFLSMGAGGAFGIISMTASQQVITALLLALGVNVATGGIIALMIAAALAFMSAIALSAVFYVYAVGYIRDKGYVEDFKSFVNKVFGAWFDSKLALSLSVQGVKNFAIRCLYTIKGLAYYTIGIALAITVVSITLGLGVEKATKLGVETFNMTKSAAELFATVMILGFSSLVNGYFYICNVFRVTALVFGKFIGLYDPNKIELKPQAESLIKAKPEEESSLISSIVDKEVDTNSPVEEKQQKDSADNAFVESYITTNKFVTRFMMTTVFFNGLGQGASVFECKAAAASAEHTWAKIAGEGVLPGLLTQTTGALALKSGSDGGNSNAVAQALYVPNKGSKTSSSGTSVASFFAKAKTGDMFNQVEEKSSRPSTSFATMSPSIVEAVA